MKDDITYIAFEKLRAIVKELGFKTEEKKGWLRINGPERRRIYLPKRNQVGRIDIAGFAAPSGTSRKLGEKSFGAVKEQLDMRAPEEKVLDRFRAVLGQMAAAPPPEKKTVATTHKTSESQHAPKK